METAYSGCSANTLYLSLTNMLSNNNYIVTYDNSGS